MSQPAQQGHLFAVTQAPVTPVRRQSASSEKVRWSKYRPLNPVKCDDCMMVLYLARGDAPASRQARWKRKQGDEMLLLCYAHADCRREEDGLKPLKDSER